MSASRSLQTTCRQCVRTSRHPTARLPLAPWVTARSIRSGPAAKRRRLESPIDIVTPVYDLEASDKGIKLEDAIKDEGVSLEAEMLAMQDEAIVQLEAKLGMSLEQAIEEDKFAVVFEKMKIGAEDNALMIEEAESPLMELRREGTSPELIAREARNIFGDTLPEGELTEEKYKIYVRMYGEPVEELDEEDDVELDYDQPELAEMEKDEIPEHILLDQAGQKVEYRLENADDIAKGMQEQEQKQGKREKDTEISIPSQTEELVNFDRMSIQDIAASMQGTLVESEDNAYPGEDPDEDDHTRSHPLTRIGKFGTSPRTIFFPQDTFIKPVTSLLADYNNKHLRETSERIFGGPGLPDSPLTPRTGRQRQQIPVPLDVAQHVMGQMEANAFVAAVMPPTYASILSTLTETRKRLGTTWLTSLLSKPGEPRILDAGSGGAAILAWREIVSAH
ncbi:37S ribosomal protein S22, partial [Elasticomyces elasticus]